MRVDIRDWWFAEIQMDAMEDKYQGLVNFPKANLVVLDYRLYNAVKTRSNLKLLKGLGIISTESWSEYQAVMYRLLLNPSSTVINSVNGLMSEFHLSRFSVAVHVRCAGKLADHKERTKMVLPYQFASIAGMVKEELSKLSNADSKTVFLSTDSSYALREITHLLNGTKVFTNTNVVRGHSDFDRERTILRSTMTDLFMLTKSNVFIGVDRSGFSRVASAISKPKRIRWIGVWKKVNK